MSTVITIADETMTGSTLHEFALEFLTERVTVRELIRARIYQEVTEHNARQASKAGQLVEFRGLVQPEGAARTGSGSRLREPRKIDWQEQYKRAVQGFQANGFLVLVDDRQLVDLDEEVVLRVDTRVSFLRLVALVGG
jgi:hypothetical protein